MNSFETSEEAHAAGAESFTHGADWFQVVDGQTGDVKIVNKPVKPFDMKGYRIGICADETAINIRKP